MAAGNATGTEIATHETLITISTIDAIKVATGPAIDRLKIASGTGGATETG